MPAVTIVSAFYNRGAHVAASVGSLLAQSLADIEIIICDDGSTDNTRAELESLRDPRLVILSQPNAGLVASLNRMIGMARAPYIAIHGSGDLSAPQRIERQHAMLEAHPEAGICGCYIEARGRIYRPAGPPGPGPHDLHAAALLRNPFSHGEVMFRKALFDRVGGYRPVFRFAQDRDLWLRMGRHAPYVVVEAPLYRRFNLGDGVSRSPEKVVAQRKLSAFAVQCALDLDADGRDPVDRLGEAALALAAPSAEVANSLARTGLGWIRRGEIEGGQHLLRAAYAERRNGMTRLCRLLTLPSPKSRFWRLVRGQIE